MIARSWSKLTPQQAFNAVLYSVEGKNTRSKMRIIEALLPLDMIPTYAQLSAKEIRALLSSVNWVFDAPILEPHINHFIINDVKFVLPEPKFKNVHLIEFSYASDFYNQMVEGKNEAMINKLIASLCRPEVKDLDRLSPQYNGDPRERFNPELIDMYADLIQHLGFEFKSYFVRYFNSCADHIVTQFKPLFTPQNANDNQGHKLETPNFGWLGVIMALADAGVFGNFEQTQYTNIYTALAYRLKKYYDEKELK
jgi:hypothetical protein